MVAACSEEAARIMTMAGANVIASAPSGSELQAAALLLSAEGLAGALHAGWKVSQTLLETAGGIAAAARAIVEAARRVKPDIVVACTRKSLPGTRSLSVKAILCGGAVPHRLGRDGVLPGEQQRLGHLTEQQLQREPRRRQDGARTRSS